MTADDSGNHIEKSEKPQGHGPMQTTSQICDRAADHIALARMALDDESANVARAVNLLDEAIASLEGISAYATPDVETFESTVIAFPGRATRRSA